MGERPRVETENGGIYIVSKKEAVTLADIIPEGWELERFGVPELGDTILEVMGDGRSLPRPCTTSETEVGAGTIIVRRGRWRAGQGEYWYFVTKEFRVSRIPNIAEEIISEGIAFESGNYFEHEWQARQLAVKFKEIALGFKPVGPQISETGGDDEA